MKNLFDLSGKVAVVTGGGGLIGKAYVKALASFGAEVYVAELDSQRSEAVCRELKKEDFNVKHLTLDITDVKSVDSAVNELISSSGHIDVWINNAYPRTKDWGLLFEKIPFASLSENLIQHLGGYFLCCQKVSEEMKKQGKGSIINIASTYGIVAPDFQIYEGTPMTMPAAYSVIKGGIINFTRYLASYYGSHGVRVNSISPGGVFDNQPASFVENYTRKTLLKRMSCPEDMAGAAVFLASDASAYVTGHNLVVDGGWTAI